MFCPAAPPTPPPRSPPPGDRVDLRPTAEPPAPTEPKPFNLRTDQRHSVHSASLQVHWLSGEARDRDIKGCDE